MCGVVLPEGAEHRFPELAGSCDVYYRFDGSADDDHDGAEEDDNVILIGRGDGRVQVVEVDIAVGQPEYYGDDCDYCCAFENLQGTV